MSHKTGQCHIRVGPMCSGKSTWLNRKLTTFADCDPDLKVLRISHQDDIRETVAQDKEHNITTHHSQFVKVSPRLEVIIVSELKKVSIDNYQIIGIDEGQFYPDLIECVKDWIYNLHKIVYITSLDGDSDGNLFGSIVKLLPMAHSFKKRKSAFCKFCLDDQLHVQAVMTASLIKKKEQKVVAGTDIYKPTCLYHHRIHNIPTS